MRSMTMSVRQLITAVFLILLVPVTMLTLGSAESQLFDGGSVLPRQTPETGALGAKDEGGYKTEWFVVEDASVARLVPNFESSRRASEAQEVSKCRLLTSGGFYNEAGGPIGYFQTSGEVLGKFEKNRLFDGVLSVNELGVPRITREVPRDPLRFGFQAGPVLIENGQSTKLNLKSDKNARRIIAVTTGENKLILMAIYDPKTVFNGPMLSALQDILESFQKDNGVIIADAINLDGGTASAFLTETVNLTELSPVGSFLCAR